ncbi:hypothetical protein [Cupriavidus sp. D39]|uniref:hypothetical protein n=1 Tax=Cupriavidus sp. D39 TaxID=2997877 RepID=UPI00226E2167|nr:hypothetical protein [Cupriavidus sp. D39]MCY0858739.1 hypothetical protein [Cupriavidus sp. D39]
MSAFVGRMHSLSSGLLGHLMFLSHHTTFDERGQRQIDFERLAEGLPSIYRDIRSCAIREGAYDLLLQCAFLPEVTKESALEISGQRDCNSTLLSIIERFPYICTKREGEFGFSWNLLFRKFLLDEADVRFTSDRICALRKMSSRLLSQEKLVESLFMVHAEAGDWWSARNLVSECAEEMVSGGLWRCLKDILLAFPKNILEADSDVQYWLGRCLLKIDPSAACRSFERALSLLDLRKKSSEYIHCIAWTIIAASLSESAREETVGRLESLVEVFDWKEPELGDRLSILCLSAIMHGFDISNVIKERAPHFVVKLQELLYRKSVDDETRLIGAISLLWYEGETGTHGSFSPLISRAEFISNTNLIGIPLTIKWKMVVAAHHHGRGNGMFHIG